MSKPAFEFTVGDWVSFTATHESYRDPDNTLRKTIERCELEKPAVGQVVGVKTIVSGLTTPAEKTRAWSPFDYEPDPGYFTVERTLVCYQVRLSMRGKPFLVAPADLVRAAEHPARLSWQGRAGLHYKLTPYKLYGHATP